MTNSRWLALSMLLGCLAFPWLISEPRAEDAAGVSKTDAGSEGTTVDGNAPGIVKEKPTSGRFVETESGYMVPYSVTIPGTEVTFMMQPIPGGKFKLGSPDDEAERGDDEGPQAEIEIAPFWMAQHEVTWAEYKSFMNIYQPLKSVQAMRSLWQTKSEDSDVVKDLAELKKSAAEMESLKNLLAAKVEGIDAITVPTPLYEPDVTYESGEDPQQPAVTMSQYAATQYTKWISLMRSQNYRLPTEAEWEYACRAGTTTAYHFGNDPDMLGDYGWFDDNADGATQQVEQKKPNPWGLYDMHGNVMEWVIDGYSEDGYKHLESGKTHLASEAISRTKKLFPRTLRGGHWDDGAGVCRSAARVASNDYEWYDTDPNVPKSPWWFTDPPAGSVGFRMIRPLKPMNKAEKTLFWETDVEFLLEDIANRLEEGRGVQENVAPTLPDALEEVTKVEETFSIE